MNMDILAFEKYEYGHFGIRKINSIYDVFKLKQNFRKNWVVTGKTPFFVIGPFCTPYSFRLNISFWQSSFVWKCSVVNLSTFNEKMVLCFFEKGLHFNYMFKVNNRNSRTRCEICSKLTIKTPERRLLLFSSR